MLDSAIQVVDGKKVEAANELIRILHGWNSEQRHAELTEFEAREQDYLANNFEEFFDCVYSSSFTNDADMQNEKAYSTKLYNANVQIYLLENFDKYTQQIDSSKRILLIKQLILNYSSGTGSLIDHFFNDNSGNFDRYNTYFLIVDNIKTIIQHHRHFMDQIYNMEDAEWITHFDCYQNLIRRSHRFLSELGLPEVLTELQSIIDEFQFENELESIPHLKQPGYFKKIIQFARRWDKPSDNQGSAELDKAILIQRCKAICNSNDVFKIKFKSCYTLLVEYHKIPLEQLDVQLCQHMVEMLLVIVESLTQQCLRNPNNWFMRITLDVLSSIKSNVQQDLNTKKKNQVTLHNVNTLLHYTKEIDVKKRTLLLGEFFSIVNGFSIDDFTRFVHTTRVSLNSLPGNNTILGQFMETIPWEFLLKFVKAKLESINISNSARFVLQDMLPGFIDKAVYSNIHYKMNALNRIWKKDLSENNETLFNNIFSHVMYLIDNREQILQFSPTFEQLEEFQTFLNETYKLFHTMNGKYPKLLKLAKDHLNKINQVYGNSEEPEIKEKLTRLNNKFNEVKTLDNSVVRYEHRPYQNLSILFKDEWPARHEVTKDDKSVRKSVKLISTRLAVLLKQPKVTLGEINELLKMFCGLPKKAVSNDIVNNVKMIVLKFYKSLHEQLSKEGNHEFEDLFTHEIVKKIYSDLIKDHPKSLTQKVKQIVDESLEATGLIDEASSSTSLTTLSAEGNLVTADNVEDLTTKIGNLSIRVPSEPLMVVAQANGNDVPSPVTNVVAPAVSNKNAVKKQHAKHKNNVEAIHNSSQLELKNDKKLMLDSHREALEKLKQEHAENEAVLVQRLATENAAKLENQRRDLEQQLARKRSSLAKQLLKLEDSNSKEIESELAACQISFEAQSAALERNFQHKVAVLTKRHNDALSAMESRYSVLLSEVRTTHEAELYSLTQTLHNQLVEAQTQLDVRFRDATHFVSDEYIVPRVNLLVAYQHNLAYLQSWCASIDERNEAERQREIRSMRALAADYAQHINETINSMEQRAPMK